MRISNIPELAKGLEAIAASRSSNGSDVRICREAAATISRLAAENEAKDAQIAELKAEVERKDAALRKIAYACSVLHSDSERILRSNLKAAETFARAALQSTTSEEKSA